MYGEFQLTQRGRGKRRGEEQGKGEKREEEKKEYSREEERGKNNGDSTATGGDEVSRLWKIWRSLNCVDTAS